jgi:hypothetical protein
LPIHILEFKIPPFPENSYHPLEFGNHNLHIHEIKRNSTYSEKPAEIQTISTG